MSANNNREGWEKALGMTEDQAIDEAWAKGHRQGLIEGRAMMRIELEHEAANASEPEPTPTPHATAPDVTMLCEAIDQLKARIDALEGSRLSVVIQGAAETLEDGTIRSEIIPMDELTPEGRRAHFAAFQEKHK